MEIDFKDVAMAFQWQLVRLHHLGPLPWDELVRRQLEFDPDGVGLEQLKAARSLRLIEPAKSEWGQELYRVAAKGREHLKLSDTYEGQPHTFTDGVLRQIADVYMRHLGYFYPIPDNPRTGKATARLYRTGDDRDPVYLVLATLPEPLNDTVKANYKRTPDRLLVFAVHSHAYAELNAKCRWLYPDGWLKVVLWEEVLPLLSPSLTEAFHGAARARLRREFA